MNRYSVSFSLLSCSGQYQYGVSNSKNDEEDTGLVNAVGEGRNLESDSHLPAIIISVVLITVVLVVFLVAVVQEIRKRLKKDGDDAERLGLIVPENTNSRGSLVIGVSTVSPSHRAIHPIPSHPVPCTESDTPYRTRLTRSFWSLYYTVRSRSTNSI